MFTKRAMQGNKTMNKRITALFVLVTLLAPLIPPGPVDPPMGTALALSLQSPAEDWAWEVTTTEDEDDGGVCTPGHCSLRHAIAAANGSDGPDIITFNIPTDDLGYDEGTGQWTITLTSPLPAISDDGIVIDALTQPGSGKVRGPGDCGPLRVIVDTNGVTYGKEVNASNTEITGFVIKNAASHGIYIHGPNTQNTLLMCNWIEKNTGDGVRISGAISNTVGTAGMGNLIYDNDGDGVEITNQASLNIVASNVISGNVGNGVHLSSGAYSNAVGQTGSGGSNLIYGNDQAGVLIASGAYTTENNVVQNNYIGIRGDGNTAQPNQNGVVIDDAIGNVIVQNLISGNSGYGVRIQNSQAISNSVQFNSIGTDAAGNAAVANGNGVLIEDAPRNTIGPQNLISGNSGYGVCIEGYQATKNVVADNTIGAKKNEMAALANQDGVVIKGASYNIIGGHNPNPTPDNPACTGACNLISGNTRDGVRIEGPNATYNVVEGNYIGTRFYGDQRVGNGRFGVVIQGEANYNTIGGDVLNEGNVISGNGYAGPDPSGNGGGVWIKASSYNVLYNNSIGTKSTGGALSNGGHGVKITDAAQHNAIGHRDLLEYANTIAWNMGDGVYIDGSSTHYNLISLNSIHDNLDLGIDNESGGNQELAPPLISKYDMYKSGFVNLQACTCMTCTVHIFSDGEGEGRQFEGKVPKEQLDATGCFDWKGTPTYSAFTLVATDEYSNTSEFSASPVELKLSIDDALSGIAVNKVPGDADALAKETVVEFVAHIVSYDPTLTQTLMLDLQIPGDVLAPPTRVFYRDKLSSYDGITITDWSSPLSGTYRVSGIALQSTGNVVWQRRVVFRFAIPHGVKRTQLAVQGTLSPTVGRKVSKGNDTATLRLLMQAEGLIITNRTLLYKNNYRDFNDSQVNLLLQKIYTLAQGSCFKCPKLAVYYVDAYNAAAKDWDNKKVLYYDENSANVVANTINNMVEDWVEDTTTAYKACKKGGWIPIDYPRALTIVGDDDVIPFYRRLDPGKGKRGSEAKSKIPQTHDFVLHHLAANDYMFTENQYADFYHGPCDEYAWEDGGVELHVGRIVGASAADMIQLIDSGMDGPAIGTTGRAVVASYDGFDIDRIVGYLTGRGFDAKNDVEAPVTIDNENWRASHITTIMQNSAGFSAFAHQGHAARYYNDDEGVFINAWGAPETNLWPSNFTDQNVRSVIAANHPLVASSGCRSGLSLGTSSSSSVVYGLVNSGASAVMGSTAETWYWKRSRSEYGEDFTQDFWYWLLKHKPGQVSAGYALQLAKRNSGGRGLLSIYNKKTWMEFTLYGLPRVGIYGNIHKPLSSQSGVSPFSGHEWPISDPKSLGSDAYVVTATLDASLYAVTQEDGFDLVTVEGMDLSGDSDVPVLPFAEIMLPLPLGSSVTEIDVTLEGQTDLGTLDIPIMVPFIASPSEDELGGYYETPDSVGIYPTQPYTAYVTTEDTIQVARIYVVPLVYDAVSNQATLYQDLTVRITYQASSDVGLSSLTVSPDDLAPAEDFDIAVSLINASDQAIALTGTLSLANDLGQVVAVQEIAQFEIPVGGEEHQLELGWTAPITDGAYSLWLELWHAGEQQVIGQQWLSVSGGRITDLAVPDGAPPGEEATFEVTFANRRGEAFEGQVTLSIYTAEGTPVMMLDAPISVGGQSEGTVELVWNTEGMPVGTYTAAATVTDDAESVTYGVVQKGFSLRHWVFLPLVMRAYP